MSVTNNKIEIHKPIEQLSLFGYKNIFKSFIKIHEKQKLPNVILLNGPKGSGKATFAYHFSNYLLSKNEKDKYSIENQSINPNSKTFNLIRSNVHPNFFLLDNDSKEDHIKIDRVRDLLKFLNKSTYHKGIKIVLIDNVELLNKNSSNALLKALEEPGKETYFILINNNSYKILQTIKSRCIEFKIFFTVDEKKNILNKLLKTYKSQINFDEQSDKFFFDTPGNILKYSTIFENSGVSLFNDDFTSISYIFDICKVNKKPEFLTFASFFIELFYNELSLQNNKKINTYHFNKLKIVNLINDIKKYNLDRKNMFVIFDNMIKTDAR